MDVTIRNREEVRDEYWSVVSKVRCPSSFTVAKPNPVLGVNRQQPSSLKVLPDLVMILTPAELLTILADLKCYGPVPFLLRQMLRLNRARNLGKTSLLRVLRVFSRRGFSPCFHL